MTFSVARIALLGCCAAFAFHAAVAAIPYAADPAFNDGLYSVDDFGISGSVVGQKIAALGDGTFVVAGVVPTVHFNSGNAAIGLGRYDRSGVPLAFANPGLYGWDGNHAIVIDQDPQTEMPFVVSAIKDLQVYSDRMFVLADVTENNTIATDILEFGTDGHFITRVFYSGSQMHGGGLAVYRTITPKINIYVALVATDAINGYARPVFDLFLVRDDLNLLSETLGNRVYPNPNNNCPATTSCELTGIAMSRQISFSQPPTFYLGGSRQTPSGNWNFLMTAVDASGTPLSSFGIGGSTIVAFENSAHEADRGTAIVADTTLGSASSGFVYLIGNVAQTCTNGVGVLAVDNTGDVQNTFGANANGRVVVGGSDVDIGTCASTIQHAEAAVAAALVPGRALAIVGSTTYRKAAQPCFISPCPELNVDGELTVLDAVTGAVDSFASDPYRDASSGPRARHSELSGVIATKNGTFTAVGDVRDFQTAAGAPPGLQQSALTRFWVADTIFADDLEQ